MTDDERERIARAALAEITRIDSVGERLSDTDEGEHVTTLAFRATMSGYPGWQWTVSVAELPGEAPTVLEAELLPGDGALLAPDWVPWSERLDEYRAAQAAAAAEAADDDAADDDDDDDADDNDDDDADDDDEFDADELDDDFGDDPDDGIDFEHGDEHEPAGHADDDADDDADEDDAVSAATVGVDETGEPDADADEARPQPPHAAGVDESADEEQ